MNQGSSSPVPPAATTDATPKASESAAAAASPAREHGMASPAPLREALREASKGLLLPSESDAPIEVVELPGRPTEASLREASGAAADAPVAATTVEAVLGPPGKLRPGQDDDERAQAERFQKLHTVVKEHLKHAAAHRVGEVDVTVWITGQDESGQWLGLRSQLTET